MHRRRGETTQRFAKEEGGGVTAESGRLRRWLDSGARAVGRERERLDAINVFPIADSDTGTNLYLTLREGNRAVARLPESASHREVVASFARGCLYGARGNSGVIVAQYLAAFLAAVDRTGGLQEATGDSIADALELAAEAAYDAVGEPVEGTILTVARAAAHGAREAVDAGAGVEAVAVAAVIWARAELARTAEVLAAAKAAGVVDAGAAGLLLQLEMLAETIAGPESLSAIDEVEWESRERSLGLTPAAEAARHELAPGGGAFEVMFVARSNRVAFGRGDRSLKSVLRRVGDSVAVTGADGRWQAHVHTDYPARAIGIARAVASTQIVVRDVSGCEAKGATGAVAITTCPGLAAALAGANATVLVALDSSHVEASDLERVIADAGTERVIVVAGAAALVTAAAALATTLTTPSVVVLDAASEPQIIAALVAAALTNPEEDPEPAMQAAVTRCTSRDTTVRRAADDLERMIGPGVEVATVILGMGVSSHAGERVVKRIARTAPKVDVIVYKGDQAVPSVIIGVETAADR
jgi:dihydroxyacetone kinase-like predicted kinase